MNTLTKYILYHITAFMLLLVYTYYYYSGSTPDYAFALSAYLIISVAYEAFFNIHLYPKKIENL